jgi:hypothetical protein
VVSAGQVSASACNVTGRKTTGSNVIVRVTTFE